MPEEIRIGPVGRVVLGMVAVAIIVTVFVVLAKENLRLAADNTQLTTANTQLTVERDALQWRVEELVRSPIVLPPGLIKPAAPLGETRWIDGRYIIIPPLPPAPPLRGGQKQSATVPSAPPPGWTPETDKLFHSPPTPGYWPDLDGTVVNQPPAVEYDPKRDGCDTVHPVPAPGSEAAKEAAKKAEKLQPSPKAHPVKIPGYQPAEKR